MAVHPDRMRRMFGDNAREPQEKPCDTHTSHLFCDKLIGGEGDYSVKFPQVQFDPRDDNQ